MAAKKPALRAATTQALAVVAAFDWKSASAGRVPKLGAAFAKLVSAKPDDRAKARTEIRTTAGEHPIGGLLAPFLVTLFADPAAPDRAALMPLLATIAVGNRGTGPFDVKAFVATLRRSRRDRFNAVAEAIPTARALLNDEDAALRAGAVMLLAYLGAPATLPDERDPLVLGTLAIASVVTSQRRLSIAHADENVSLAAAIAAASLPGPVDDATLARLELALAKPNATWPGFPWNDGNIGALARERYLALADRHGERVVAHASTDLGPDPAAGVGALIKVLFPTRVKRNPILSAAQLAVLRTALANPAIATPAFLASLGQLGLPSDAPQLRDLVGLDVPAPALITRPITLDGKESPFHVTWLRWWWGRSRGSPRRIAELGFAGLDAAQAIQAFDELVKLQDFLAPTLALDELALPAKPRGSLVPPAPDAVKPFWTYMDAEPAMDRARDYAALLEREAGWRILYAPVANGNFGDACLLRADGVVLSIKTNVVWDDDRPTKMTQLTLDAEWDPARVIGPLLHAAHGRALQAPLAAVASRTDLGNMPKWWTLSLATVLAEEAGEPPTEHCDELFRRCYVSWVPSPWRIAYLKVLPRARAKKLAAWLQAKEKNITWLAGMFG